MTDLPGIFHDESDYDCTLSAAELEALGDINGLQLLHLTAALPYESFALARLGASVFATGVLSPDLGNDLAVERGLDATLVSAALADLPDEDRDDQFDVVYAGPTTLAWTENLNDWAVDVAEALVDGGRFVMYDEHPDSRELLPPDDEPDPEVAGETGEDEPFVDLPVDQGWTLADLTAALESRGLVVARFESLYGPQRFLTVEDAVTDGQDNVGVPTAFVLVATRPAAD